MIYDIKVELLTVYKTWLGKDKLDTDLRFFQVDAENEEEAKLISAKYINNCGYKDFTFLKVKPIPNKSIL